MVALVTLAVHSANNLFQKSNLEGLTDVMCDPYFVILTLKHTLMFVHEALELTHLALKRTFYSGHIL